MSSSKGSGAGPGGTSKRPDKREEGERVKASSACSMRLGPRKLSLSGSVAEPSGSSGLSWTSVRPEEEEEDGEVKGFVNRICEN